MKKILVLLMSASLVLFGYARLSHAAADKQEINDYLNSLSQLKNPQAKDSESIIEYREIPGVVGSATPSNLMWQITHNQDEVSHEMELIKWKGATKQSVWPGAIYTGASINKGSPGLLRVGCVLQ